MAPQQGPEVPDTGRLVADGDEGQALVRPSGASQEVPGALCHQHEVQGQDDLGVRLAGLLALLEGRRGRVVSSPCPEGSEVYWLSFACPLLCFSSCYMDPPCCAVVSRVVEAAALVRDRLCSVGSSVWKACVLSFNLC